jgi:hypothetical protein
LTRPSHGGGNLVEGAALSTHQLPEAYPSWNQFWDRLAREGV